jgi:hypothetical protein
MYDSGVGMKFTDMLREKLAEFELKSARKMHTD